MTELEKLNEELNKKFDSKKVEDINQSINGKETVVKKNILESLLKNDDISDEEYLSIVTTDSCIKKLEKSLESSSNLKQDLLDLIDNDGKFNFNDERVSKVLLKYKDVLIKIREENRVEDI